MPNRLNKFFDEFTPTLFNNIDKGYSRTFNSNRFRTEMAQKIAQAQALAEYRKQQAELARQREEGVNTRFDKKETNLDNRFNTRETNLDNRVNLLEFGRNMRADNSLEAQNERFGLGEGNKMFRLRLSKDLALRNSKESAQFRGDTPGQKDNRMLMGIAAKAATYPEADPEIDYAATVQNVQKGFGPPQPPAPPDPQLMKTMAVETQKLVDGGVPLEAAIKAVRRKFKR